MTSSTLLSTTPSAQTRFGTKSARRMKCKLPRPSVRQPPRVLALPSHSHAGIPSAWSKRVPIEITHASPEDCVKVRVPPMVMRVSPLHKCILA